MASFDDDELDQCLCQFSSDDPESRNTVLTAAQEQLRLMAHRFLAEFPGVRRFEDTDDILQKSLIRMDRTLRQIEVKTAGDFFRLAAMQIRYELIDLLRHYKSYLDRHITPNPQHEGQPKLHEQAETATWDPEKITQWQEFHQAVDTLSEREQLVFTAIWYQGLKKTQAAKVLGLSVDQVAYSWVSARTNLIETLDGELPG